MLVAPGEDRAACERELIQAALEYARSEKLSSIHVLFCTELEWTTLEALGFAPRLGVQYQWHNAGYSSFDDFLGRLTSKRRTQLRRERPAPAPPGPALRRFRGRDQPACDPAQ